MFCRLPSDFSADSGLRVDTYAGGRPLNYSINRSWLPLATDPFQVVPGVRLHQIRRGFFRRSKPLHRPPSLDITPATNRNGRVIGMRKAGMGGTNGMPRGFAYRNHPVGNVG